MAKFFEALEMFANWIYKALVKYNAERVKNEIEKENARAAADNAKRTPQGRADRINDLLDGKQ